MFLANTYLAGNQVIFIHACNVNVILPRDMLAVVFNKKRIAYPSLNIQLQLFFKLG
jgi:hypothetical protein